MSTKKYKIKIAGQNYDIEIGDLSSSPVEVSVDGTLYQVELPEHIVSSRPSVDLTPSAQRVSKPPEPVSRPSVPTAGSDGVVRAPMPGKILNVGVSVGDAVTKGQSIVVLESMKMENTIAAPVDGTVSSVLVAAGDAVQHGQSLAEITQG